MKQADDSPYWVDVIPEDEETEEKLRTAVAACQAVHEWAMVEMRSIWTDSEERRVGYNELVVRMTKNLWGLGVKNQAQRFSLVTALSRAVGRFNQEMVVTPVVTAHIDEDTVIGAQIIFPNTRMPEEYRVLDVQSRSVWRNYMTYYNRFSTHYGGIYLDEEDWREKLSSQARKEGFNPDLIYYLVYSATIKEKEGQWKAHFNFHKPQSLNGKKRLERA